MRSNLAEKITLIPAGRWLYVAKLNRVIERFHARIKAQALELGKLKIAIGMLRESVSDAEERIEELLNGHTSDEDVCELARILAKLKRGRADEAAGDLDRLLQRIDGDAKLRTAAVPVML